MLRFLGQVNFYDIQYLKQIRTALIISSTRCFCFNEKAKFDQNIPKKIDLEGRLLFVAFEMTKVPGMI